MRVSLQNLSFTEEATVRIQRTKTSYQAAFARHHTQQGLTRISWVTWSIIAVTTTLWVLTASQAALAAGAHGVRDILMHIIRNAITIQPQDDQAISKVLITDGAKYNTLIMQRQYWRLIAPVFLHVNALHLGLNMLNLLFLGIYLERLAGHIRLLFIYLVSGVISIIASFHFAPQELSVGASGALFGLVGAYSIFIVMHRRAMNWKGIPAIIELIVIVGFNLALGLVIPNVDNYAHVGGLISGCFLGWWFMPYYKVSANDTLTDTHRLSARWPLVLLTILGTLSLAMIALYLNGIKS
ncbi:MAG TPA: rhomboid family intramembrane serine protease [Ktedonobacteraceae bacterium]|nr:rhomboid family intramembrane serine protease [Ktedonobacteraceae bacterium]